VSLNRNPREDGRRCPLCGGDDFRLMHEWEVGHPRNSATVPLSVWQCRCGLVILHPVPTAEQLPQSGDWWTEQRKFIKRNKWLKRIRKPIQNFFFGEQKTRLVKQTRRAMPGGKLLDVGCGTGKLLKIAARWYECEGVEPSETAVAECRRQGFKVTLGFFEDVDLPPASYDVITMDAVMEHVLDPVVVLTRINHLLRPGGVVAIKVPKLNGPAHARHGREWNGFRLGYHTYLFTGETLGRALRMTGFEVLESPQRDRWLDDLLALWGRKVRAADARIADAA
jgi:SAM-dependent methyltransferase